MTIQIAPPSILPADFCNLERDLKAISTRICSCRRDGSSFVLNLTGELTWHVSQVTDLAGRRI